MKKTSREIQSIVLEPQRMATFPGTLIYTPYAAKRQLDLIGWLQDNVDNRREQAGLLLGYMGTDNGRQPTATIVTEVLMAQTSCRCPDYVEWSGLEHIRMLQQFYNLKEKLVRTNPEAADRFSILGWWHTHPNTLPVFMSSVDMDTQKLYCFFSNRYAVVLNPHTGIWKAFFGKNADEVPAIMLSENRQDMPAPPGTRKCQKSHRNKKRQ